LLHSLCIKKAKSEHDYTSNITVRFFKGNITNLITCPMKQKCM